jgi:ankyrin repeat protein
MLKALPTTLDETYTRMLERIEPTVSEDALTLLRWLAYAARPITLAELQSAVTIRPEDDEVDFEDEGDFRDSLDILAGLVVLSDGADPTEDDGRTKHGKVSLETSELTPGAWIRLAHFSVKEYLESERISGSSASFFRLETGACHRFLAQSCLTYLMCYSKSGEKASPKLDLERFHLLDYAANKWYQHSRLQSGDYVSREVALLECQDFRMDWLRISELNMDGLRLSVYDTCSRPSISYAAFLRLLRVAKELLEAGQDASAIGPQGAPLLMTATRHKDQAMVELLLAHGADVDMNTSGSGGNALYLAASRGLLLTKLLVDNGADVNSECAFGTPLSAASRANDQSVVKFLLESGARIDIKSRFKADHPHIYTTPLLAATRSGHTDVMAILIDAGADVDAKNSRALIQALRYGQEHVVAFLEARGAKKPTLKRLTDAFMKVCHACGPRTPHREKAINLLLDRGANVNADGGRALSDALARGDPRMVALLEARGAKLTLEQLNHALLDFIDIDSLPSPDISETALNLLLDRGADVNAKHSSALLSALKHGHEHMVALLEAKGAKKPTLEQLNRTLIQVCDDQRLDFPKWAVELLLDRGADVSAEDSSALLGALRCGHEDAVALLEAKGAKKPTPVQLKDALVEVRGDEFHWRFESAFQMLLDRGADGDAANPDTSLIE